MRHRSRLVPGLVIGLSLLGSVVPGYAQTTGIREVTATDRSLIPLNTRLRYTTMIVLPDGEEILDVICGDRDFWVISAVQNVAHVKPAKSGAETNLNLVTGRGTIYSFLLNEKNGSGQPDLKVYVNADQSIATGRQKYYSAADVERLQSELTQAKEATTQAEQRAREAAAVERQQLAVGMLLIIFVTGRPEAPATTRQAAAPAQPPTADRVRDYQERLRLLDEQAAREAREAAIAQPSLPPAMENDAAAPAQVDPIVAERKRREYESLFASNVVLSRRPDAQRPDAGSLSNGASATTSSTAREPSIDDIADAVVRATDRSATPSGQDRVPSKQPVANSPAQTSDPDPGRPTATPPISALGPLHRILEGTLIDAVLTNRLDGSVAAPVGCLVTNPVYSHSGQHVLIPAGARVLGETRPVQTYGETRLAVAFHRLIMPDGSTVPLDQFRGLNQIGDSGLKDRVNQHYWSTFGAAAAVGLVSGLAQLLGSAGLGLGDGDRTVVIAGSAADATAQASAQVMNRFLNRLPTITIREGHRVKVYITSDLELPAWVPIGAAPGSQGR